jgi:hypothetical protein
MLICLVVFALCSCSGDKAKNVEWEKKQKAAIEAFIAQTNGAMKVGEIAVAAADKSFTLKNVEGRVDIKVPGPDMGLISMSYKIAQVRGEGVNFFDNPPAGATDSLKKLTLTDFVMITKIEISPELRAHGGASMPSEISHTASFAEYVCSDLKGDFSLLKEILSGKLENPDVAKIFSFSVGQGAGSKYVVEFAVPDDDSGKMLPLRYTVDSFSYKSVNADGIGPSEFKNINVFLEGRNIFALEKMSMRGLSIPGLLLKLFTLEGKARAQTLSSDEFSAIIDTQEIVLDDMRFENMTVVSVKPEIAVNLKNVGFSAKHMKSAVTLKVDMQGLLLTPELLSLDEDLVEFAARLKNIYPKPLSLSLAFDAETAARESGEDLLKINKARFAEDNLGSIEVTMELLRKKSADSGPLFAEPPFVNDDFSLLKGLLTLKDSGLVDLGFKAGASFKAQDPAALAQTEAMMRQLVSAAVSMQCLNLGQALSGICLDFNKYIQAPGEFELGLAPAQPVSMENILELLLASDAKVLGLSWKYTPPAPPKK